MSVIYGDCTDSPDFEKGKCLNPLHGMRFTVVTNSGNPFRCQGTDPMSKWGHPPSPWSVRGTKCCTHAGLHVLNVTILQKILDELALAAGDCTHPHVSSRRGHVTSCTATEWPGAVVKAPGKTHLSTSSRGQSLRISYSYTKWRTWIERCHAVLPERYGPNFVFTPESVFRFTWRRVGTPPLQPKREPSARECNWTRAT
jgi:hypothetical protein